ncbi:ERMES complex Ca(2+)-binding regulatory GTPase gem1 [Malassezia vespertilionis]|uniref:Mitochondrial Rho GTPase n=1 Tax=Malassezia vespertilionis TaxID=2020962 RepID=A0A2N1JDG1_9BASI|nr:ERMES complex Ca(2+)-binding regulatory GTPase gem1 [Malassezia vespertilionis]PKI84579.1 Gem1p [Malassezia vespertilionis]WFD06508.1 ERMES complex Ca(2+)-binding regulatory GTPase gem1 [Malassezia vespertilionis]
MRQEIRLVLAGDSGVGKSTLVTSLIKEIFVDDVQPVVPEITLPLDVSPEGVLTKIVDTCAAGDFHERFETELRRANVIALVYSVMDTDSFERIPSYWLPYIRSLGINVPVILVGNKVDLRSNDLANEELEEEIAPVMSDFKEVETCIECSAKQLLNVSEVFFYAQKAVLYPTAPLYDSRLHVLKPACVDALHTIFQLCDTDKDGVLSDVELNEFQRLCFKAPLQLEELEGIRALVSDGTSGLDGDPALRDGALTLAGFLYLHTLFIQRGRLETTWTVLWTFGYGMDLTLTNAYVYPHFVIPPGCAAELSPNGYQFLTEVFKAHDKDHDGALSATELAALFATAPGKNHPWGANFPASTETDEAGAVTLQGWLAQWSMTTLLEHRTTLAYLAYLGYPLFANPFSNTSLPGSGTVSPHGANMGMYTSASPTSYAWMDGTAVSTRPRQDERLTPATTALKLVRPRKAADRKKSGADRCNVFLALVLGAPGSGKTALLCSLLGKPFQTKYTPTNKLFRAVNAVEEGGAEQYLVLQEYGSHQEAEALRSPSKLANVSAIVYVYDSSDTNSFSYITNLRQQFPHLSTLPSLFVATKADLDLVQQRHEVQPDVYCRKLGLRIPHLGAGPLNVSVRQHQVAGLYSLLLSIAANPRGAVPQHSSSLSYARMRWKMAAYVFLALFGATGTAWAVLRIFFSRGPSLASLASAKAGSWFAPLWGGAARSEL